jgi:hypothetical protein
VTKLLQMPSNAVTALLNLIVDAMLPRLPSLGISIPPWPAHALDRTGTLSPVVLNV